MIRVQVAVALADSQEVLALELPDGSTVGEALAAARLRERYPQLQAGGARFGIWSQPCEAGAILRDGDRVEIYRPLKADAKALRRARVKPSSPRSRSGP